MSDAPWYDTYGPEGREAVFEVTRVLDAEAQGCMEKARALAPQFGEVPGGAAHFDESLRAEAIWAVLRGVRRGLSPLVAAEAAKASTREVIERWNSHHADLFAKRWAGTMDSAIEEFAQRIVQVMVDFVARPLPRYSVGVDWAADYMVHHPIDTRTGQRVGTFYLKTTADSSPEEES